MNTPSLLDCIVIGAGPAGCSAASWAAQMGLRVAVIERAAGSSRISSGPSLRT